MPSIERDAAEEEEEEEEEERFELKKQFSREQLLLGKNEISATNSDVAGRFALVTGATSGIGKQCALDLAIAGAKVCLGCRDIRKAKRVMNEMIDLYPHLERYLVVIDQCALDVMSIESVKRYCERYNEEIGELDILVNNAGVAKIRGYSEENGVSKLVMTNFLGPAVMTMLLRESFEKAITKRTFANCVFVSSVCHRFGSIRRGKVNNFLYDYRFGSYSDTKLACVAFANELEYRWGAMGVRCSSVDPGAVHTTIFNSVKCLKLTQFLRKMCYAPAHDGARAVTMAALYPFAPQNMCFNSSPQMRAMDQGSRHFSRGLFAGKFIGTYGPTKFPEEGNFVQKFIWHAWTFMFASCVFWISLFDWPVRKYFKGQKFDGTRVVLSSDASYDQELGTELWEIVKEFSGNDTPAFGERFTSNDSFCADFLETLEPKELSIEEMQKILDQDREKIMGVNGDGEKIKKASENDDNDHAIKPPAKKEKKKHKRTGSSLFFRRASQEKIVVDKSLA